MNVVKREYSLKIEEKDYIKLVRSLSICSSLKKIEENVYYGKNDKGNVMFMITFIKKNVVIVTISEYESTEKIIKDSLFAYKKFAEGKEPRCKVGRPKTGE